MNKLETQINIIDLVTNVMDKRPRLSKMDLSLHDVESIQYETHGSGSHNWYEFIVVADGIENRFTFFCKDGLPELEKV